MVVNAALAALIIIISLYNLSSLKTLVTLLLNAQSKALAPSQAASSSGRVRMAEAADALLFAGRQLPCHDRCAVWGIKNSSAVAETFALPSKAVEMLLSG